MSLTKAKKPRKKRERWVTTLGGGRVLVGRPTKEEEFDFYRRTGNGIVSMTPPGRGRPTVAPDKQPPGLSEDKL